MATKTVRKPVSALAAKLKQLKEAWANNREESKTGGGPVPPGLYITQLQKMELRTETNNGKKWFHLGQEYVVTDDPGNGDAAGQVIYRNNGLETDENILWLQRDLRRLGEDVDDLEIENLEAVVEKFNEWQPRVSLRVKIKGEYTNVHIEKLLEEQDGVSSEELAEEGDVVEEDEVGEAEEETQVEEEAEAEEEGEGELDADPIEEEPVEPAPVRRPAATTTSRATGRPAVAAGARSSTSRNAASAATAPARTAAATNRTATKPAAPQTRTAPPQRTAPAKPAARPAARRK